MRTNIIQTGLRAYIFAYRGNIFRTAFCVTNTENSPAEFVFYTGRLGYQAAYEAATKKYCKLRKVPKKHHDWLLANVPDKKIFTRFLVNHVKNRGYDITAACIRGQLK